MAMIPDKKVRIISDGALFLVTTEEHSQKYSELEFWEVDEESLKEYE